MGIKPTDNVNSPCGRSQAQSDTLIFLSQKKKYINSQSRTRQKLKEKYSNIPKKFLVISEKPASLKISLMALTLVPLGTDKSFMN
jgi:hypothetical protein